MRCRWMLMRVGILAGAAVLVVACDGSGVAVQSVGSSTASPSSSATSPTAGMPGSDETAPSASSTPSSTAESAEQTDRAAAEAQWVKSWDVYLAIATTPADERDAVAATVTVDPAKTRMLTDAAEFDKQGLQTYGQIGHKIFWTQSINGGDTALLDDCQDRSASGSLDTTSGNKVTVGVAGLHYQGQMVRGTDGVWRVSDSFFLKDEPC